MHFKGHPEERAWLFLSLEEHFRDTSAKIRNVAAGGSSGLPDAQPRRTMSGSKSPRPWISIEMKIHVSLRTHSKEEEQLLKYTSAPQVQTLV